MYMLLIAYHEYTINDLLDLTQCLLGECMVDTGRS